MTSSKLVLFGFIFYYMISKMAFEKIESMMSAAAHACLLICQFADLNSIRSCKKDMMRMVGLQNLGGSKMNIRFILCGLHTNRFSNWNFIEFSDTIFHHTFKWVFAFFLYLSGSILSHDCTTEQNEENIINITDGCKTFNLFWIFKYIFVSSFSLRALSFHRLTSLASCHLLG